MKIMMHPGIHLQVHDSTNMGRKFISAQKASD